MPVSRFLLMIGAVLAASAVTVLVLMALPPSLRPWLIPILLAAALALRGLSRRG